MGGYGYTALQINANSQVDKAEEFTYNDYVKVYYEVSEIPYVKEMTSEQKIKNAIWKATGIGYIMDSVYGFSLINGDNLTAGEAEARFIDGTATTIFNIFPVAVSKACGAGLLEATILSMKEIEFNALWMASPSIGEEVGIPELSYLMRLCLMVGAVYDVGRVDDTVGIHRSEDDVILNETKSFAELMSPEDAKRYLEFLENGSVEGLTPAELAGIQKVDDWIALNKVDYDEVLALSNRVSESGLDTLSTSSSRILRKNLIDVGVGVPDYPNAAHHIVAGNSPKAAEARAILQKYGIDINDASNGTFLPTVKNVAEGAYHPSLHTNVYYDKVNKLLSEATCKEDVLDILEFIDDELSSGTFMQ